MSEEPKGFHAHKNGVGTKIVNAFCKETEARGGNLAEILGPLIDGA